MTGIIGAVFLLAVYQVAQAQRTTNWGIYLCQQVEGKCGQYFTGSPGITGRLGDPGERGLAGPKGRTGDKGSKGFSYIVEPFPLFGPKGRKGQKGTQGGRGQRGGPGPRGEPGDPGPRGVIGVQGDLGSPGFPGLKGPKGQQGASGSIQSWKSCSWKFDPLQQYGLLKECVFNKHDERSVLHVIFEGSMRVGYCTSCCKRWFFAFDGRECRNADIEARLQGTKKYAGMEFRHVRLEGYCARPAGELAVELWVEDCPGHSRAQPVPLKMVDSYPRITVEEITINDLR